MLDKLKYCKVVTNQLDYGANFKRLHRLFWLISVDVYISYTILWNSGWTFLNNTGQVAVKDKRTITSSPV